MDPVNGFSTMAPTGSWGASTLLRRFRGNLFIPAALAILILIILRQYQSGGYSVEFGSNTDEAAHFVTGLMVSEYLKAPNASPMAFAENYYLHYPKVAFGVWPPLHDLLLGLWITLTSNSRVSVILFEGLIAWITSLAVLVSVRKSDGGIAGFCAAALFATVPVVQHASSAVILDFLTALFCYLAATAFGSYLNSGRWQDSARFGLLASLAILTKYNALGLVFVPLVAITLAKRLDLLRRASFWLSAAIVGVLCAPWYIAFRHLVQYAAEPIPTAADVVPSVIGNIVLLISAIGLPLTTLSTIGLIHWLRAGVPGTRSLGIAMLALSLSVILFHSVLYPIVEARYLLPAVAAMISSVPAGVLQLSKSLHLNSRAWILGALTTACVVLQIVVFSVRKPDLGFRHAVEPALQRAQGNAVLIASDAVGEGSFVAEVAMRAPSPTPYVLRGSKLLAKAHWSGANYTRVYKDEQELLAVVNDAGVAAIVIEPGASRAFAHVGDLVRVLNQRKGCWKAEMTSNQKDIFVYYRSPGCEITRRKSIAVDMTRTLKKTLTIEATAEARERR